MEAMNRLGFVQRCLAALGVGAVTKGNRVRMNTSSSRPAPPCTRCNGTGFVEQQRTSGLTARAEFGYQPHPWSVEWLPCPSCGGGVERGRN